MINKKVKEEHSNSVLVKKSGKTAGSIGKKKLIYTRIRKIGNSKGILLSNSIIKELGIEDDTEVTVTTDKGSIVIKPSESKTKINSDLSTWEAQFKKAIKNGDEPEGDMFEGIENKFDTEEW